MQWGKIEARDTELKNVADDCGGKFLSCALPAAGLPVRFGRNLVKNCVKKQEKAGI
jgi:hypothetical protein